MAVIVGQARRAADNGPRFAAFDPFRPPRIVAV